MPDTLLDQTSAELDAQKVAIVDGTPVAGEVAMFAAADHIEAVSPDALASEMAIANRLLATHEVSVAQAAVTFASRNAPGQSGAIFQGDYNTYVFHFDEVLPVSNGANFIMEVSTDGGATWISAASSYFYSYFWYQNAPTSGVQNDSSYSSTYVLVVNSVQYAAAGNNNEGVCGSLTVFRPLAARKHKYVGDVVAFQTSGRQIRAFANGWHTGVVPITAVRFRFTAGDVATGIITCVGLTK